MTLLVAPAVMALRLRVGLAARGRSQSFSGGETKASHLNCAEREWSVDVA